jgi:nitronate monooxygenase
MSDKPETPFTRLVGCELPIQLAPIGGSGQVPELALAVTGAGGHAVYPAVSLSAAEAESAIDRLRAATGAFGLNFIVPLIDPEVLELAASRAPLVDLFYGEPTRELVEIVHRGGALASWQAGSLEEALSAVDCGCDLVVVQGVEAGGRVRGQLGTGELLDQVLQAVDVPVLAAGGIATADEVADAMAAGAHGVRVGTRFLASREANVHPDWQQASAEESVITRAFAAGVPDFPHRVLHRSLQGAETFDGAVVGSQMTPGGARKELPRWCPDAPQGDFQGHVEAMPFYAGTSVAGVREVLPAAEIVAELAAGIPTPTVARG